MTGTAHRQELGDALHHGQHNGLGNGHELLIFRPVEDGVDLKRQIR